MRPSCAVAGTGQRPATPAARTPWVVIYPAGVGLIPLRAFDVIRWHLARLSRVPGLTPTLSALIARLEAMALAEDEHAPHVVLVLDPECGLGPAAGPFDGVMPALAAAAELEAALNEDKNELPVRVEVVRLFSWG